MPIRAVLDTNVVYSGLRSRNGASFAILDALERGEWTLVLSNTVLTEYEEVLKRQLRTLPIDIQSVDLFLDSLATHSERHTMAGAWIPMLSDPDDEAFLQLAVEASADCLVTHNLAHFVQMNFARPKLLAPREFLRIIKP